MKKNRAYIFLYFRKKLSCKNARNLKNLDDFLLDKKWRVRGNKGERREGLNVGGGEGGGRLRLRQLKMEKCRLNFSKDIRDNRYLEV